MSHSVPVPASTPQVPAGGSTPVTAAARNQRRLTIVLVLTATYLVAEVVGGILTKSLALLADAGHMLTDVAGVALALFAIRFAARPATPERTYGYYRAEILAALANAVVLIGISFYILYEAWQRFRNPPVVESAAMLWVAGIGLVVNLVSMRILRDASTESLNMKGAYFEVLSDMLTSIGVIIAGVIMLTTGWYYADPIVSAGIGLFILPRTWRLLREAVGVLLEGTPADVNLAAVRDTVMATTAVSDVHDLHVWSLTSGRNALSAHVVMAPGSDHTTVLRAAQAAINQAHATIVHVTLQLEPPGWEQADTHT